MSPTFATAVEPFVDRRNYSVQPGAPKSERRQFTNSHEELSPDFPGFLVKPLAAVPNAY